MFFFCGKRVYRKIVWSCNFFFAVMRVMGLHDLPQKKLDNWTIFLVKRIYRKKKKLHELQYTAKNVSRVQNNRLVV